MTHQEFLQAWSIKYPGKETLLENGQTFFYPAKGTQYVRATCPYCQKTPLGPDKNHHLHVHYEAGWFKCMRCTTGGSIEFLLGKKQKPKKTESWNSFTLKPEDQKINPAIITRSLGNTPSKVKPGLCIPIQKVPQDSVAWKYLKNEGFSTKQILQLAKTHGISLCVQGPQFTKTQENTTTGRLIFEIWEGETLLGWQARWLPSQWPPSQKDKETEKKVQKYLISPGLKKSHMLYNWTQAQNFDTWILVEGIKKVWKTGPFALGSLGIGNQVKPPDDSSEKAFLQYWSVRLARGNRPIGILYDKGAEQTAKIHAEGIQKLGAQAKVILLPEDGPKDLDNYTTIEILQIIKNQMGKLPKRIKI